MMLEVLVKYLIKSIFSCPAYTPSSDTPLMQLLNMNPNVRNMMESNTQMREMIENPEFLRQLTSPETLQVINHTALATYA